MDKIIDKIKESLINKDSFDETPLFTKKGFIGIDLSTDNFHEIKPNNNNSVTFFVDGGNAELIEANNLSLQLIRVGAVGYQDNKKIFLKKKDYYCLITFKDDKFKVETTPNNLKFEFNINDESLKDGRGIAKISRIGGFIRRILELELASQMIKKANYLILDGSLEEKFTYEKKYLLDLYKKAKEQDVCVVGFCKTNNLITKNGSSVSKTLLDMKIGAWYYHPIATINSEEFLGDVCFAKLNEKSEHVFRVDVYNQDLKKLFSDLYTQCSDLVFIGYPYGLIEVDSVARITNKEKEYEKTKLMIKFGKDYEQIKKLQNTTNAHQILDNIS